MKTSLDRLFQNMLPVLIGITAFLIVVGPRVLDPTNIGWLGRGDPATHYIGWLFYKNSDWTFPIGLNPDYGLELGNAIIFSDSIPLFAFVFKLLSPNLPEPFQYFGFWLLVCFVLQAWFGYKLIGLWSNSVMIRALSAALVVFAPPMIWRLHGHLSLVGHFLIIAALYLVFHPEPKRRILSWILLLVFASLTHPYLFAMTGLLWLADLQRRSAQPIFKSSFAIKETAATVAVLAVTCWQAGYFSVGKGTSGGGFGIYRMNLLSVVDANGWSYILGDIPGGANEYAGSNFLGLGMIFLALCMLPKFGAIQSKFAILKQHYRPLLWCLVALALFAASNKIGIGPFVIEYPIPGAVKDLANMFRASERMFWPVFYVLVLAIIIGIVTEYSKPVAVGLLSCALIVQVVDTSAAWLGIRNWLMAPPKTVWSTPLAHPFWSETAVKYKKVRHIPPGNHSKNWMPLADYASKHQLATDAVYLARVSSSELGQARRKAEHALWTGAYDADAIYVLSDAVLRQAAITLRPEDALAKVDGINILAPGWRSCGKCSPLESQVDIFGLVPKVRLGESIAFGIDGKGLAHTLGGWHLPEGQGTWSSAKSAELIFLVPDNARGLQLDAVPLVSPRHPSQKVVIKINDIPILTRNLSEHDGEIIQLDFPGALRKKVQGSGVMRIQFEFENAARPKDIGVNADRRRLAINIRNVAFY